MQLLRSCIAIACLTEGNGIVCQAAEVRTAPVCGLDMSAVDRHRWTPAFTTGHCWLVHEIFKSGANLTKDTVAEKVSLRVQCFINSS